jgi:hypothetical protein
MGDVYRSTIMLKAANLAVKVAGIERGGSDMDIGKVALFAVFLGHAFFI